MSKRQKWLTCWVPRRLELIVSPAWKARPVAVMRILERLEEEHLRHGGRLNGQLFVAYSQFQLAGVSRRVIKHALECARDLGLIEIIQEGEPRGDVRPPNAYSLTYLPIGKASPSDAWKRVKEERSRAIAERFRAATGRTAYREAAEKAA